MSIYIINKQLNQVFFEYKIFDTTYWSNFIIEPLENFISNTGFDASKKKSFNLKFPNQFSTEINNGEYLIDNDWVKLKLQKTSFHYSLDINSQNFKINQTQIEFNRARVNSTYLLGPALVLNLALNNIFCLHCSAFIYKSQVFILLAESGTGKSSIAKFVDSLGEGKRIADDILAMKSIHSNGVKLYPEFPQLKLAKQEQAKMKPIECQPVLLFAKKADSTSCSKIDSITSIKRMISHSVASRLFDKELLGSHTKFCQETNAISQCYNLDYSHNENSLKKVISILDELV